MKTKTIFLLILAFIGQSSGGQITIQYYNSIMNGWSKNPTTSYIPQKSILEAKKDFFIITKKNETIEDDTIVVNWKKYTNIKLGFTFKYPSTWVHRFKDIEAVNLKGEISVIGITFSDTLTHTSVLIEYHLPPEGAKVYQYANSQFTSSQGWYATESRRIVVAGNNAIEGVSRISTDGKGTPVTPPLVLIIVDFLDKKKTGTIEIQFKTSLSGSEKERYNFRKVLSTFHFTK